MVIMENKKMIVFRIKKIELYASNIDHSITQSISSYTKSYKIDKMKRKILAEFLNQLSFHFQHNNSKKNNFFLNFV